MQMYNLNRSFPRVSLKLNANCFFEHEYPRFFIPNHFLNRFLKKENHTVIRTKKGDIHIVCLPH